MVERPARNGVSFNYKSDSYYKGDYYMKKNQITVNDMAYCAIFVVLIIVGAFIKIPIPVCPFTLQFFFTTMAGVILGPKRGAISVVIYTILGLVGLPIFAEGGEYGIYSNQHLGI